MRSLRVLVLEDHCFQRSIAVSMLHQLGCETVLEASGGAQALQLLEHFGPVDVALCDLRMEGMDGLAFIQQATDAGLIGSVIICSSLESELRRSVAKVVKLTGMRVLGDMSKPLRMDTLQSLLCELDEQPTSALALISVLELPSEHEVRHGLENNQFVAYYQPKFLLRNGAPQGLEVLARWDHPERGVLSPAVFMPVLQRCGLLNELFLALFEQGLRLQAEMRQQDQQISLAFNLDTTQLTNPELVPCIEAMLRAHAVPSNLVTFELTETGLIDAPASSLETLVRLRMLGCGLSIDDFGAGFSSLERLCDLPFTEMKLDATFVRSLHQSRCLAIVKSTLALAAALKMTLVVEGIETAAQYHELLSLGCVTGQGYWYSRPKSYVDIKAWLLGSGTKYTELSSSY